MRLWIELKENEIKRRAKIRQVRSFVHACTQLSTKENKICFESRVRSVSLI